MKAKPVYCLWEDATTAIGLDGWIDLKEDPPKCDLVETLGFLVAEDEKAVTIALCVQPESSWVNMIITIPHGWIIKLVEVDLITSRVNKK